MVSTVDYALAGAVVLGAAALLTRSRVLRALVWESLRHPFSKGFVVRQGNEVKVVRGVSLQEEKERWEGLAAAAVRAAAEGNAKEAGAVKTALGGRGPTVPTRAPAPPSRPVAPPPVPHGED
jgi:hypothetical protein